MLLCFLYLGGEYMKVLISNTMFLLKKLTVIAQTIYEVFSSDTSFKKCSIGSIMSDDTLNEEVVKNKRELRKMDAVCSLFFDVKK